MHLGDNKNCYCAFCLSVEWASNLNIPVKFELKLKTNFGYDSRDPVGYIRWKNRIKKSYVSVL